MGMRALVTGAAGFIGSHLCDRLLSDGDHVIGVDCFTDYYERQLKERNLEAARSNPRFELFEADLVSTDLSEALVGADAVFHLAAQPGVRGSWGTRFDVYARNNILATQRLLESVLATERPIPFLYASSSSVYGSTLELPTTEESPLRPISPYGVTKLAGEHLASLYGSGREIPVSVVRYFTLYGPRQRPDMAFSRFIRSALTNDEAEVLGNGGQSRDFTFVSDAVDATVRAIGAPPGSCFNVAGGTRTTINEALGLIGEVIGRPMVIRRSPRAAGDVQDTYADTSRAREQLGWRPSTDLAEGLKQQIEWLSGLIRTGA